MHRRFTKYVDTQSHGCIVKCKLTADRAFALIREYVSRMCIFKRAGRIPALSVLFF